MSTSAATGTSPKPLTFALGVASDERLAALVAAGNERAFAAIYSRYHQRLYRYCLTMLRNESDAQDALQSAFMSAFTALRDDRRNAPLRPWLFRIAHNESISLLRRRRPDAALDEMTDTAGRSLDEQVGERAELQTLIADLRELPERQRAALVMRELSGLAHEDIALALDVSSSSAKQTIFEARRSLMEFAAGREIGCDEIRRTLSDGDGRAGRGRRVRAHLRSCEGCSEFSAHLRRRRTALKAITPPLPALLAKELLGRVTRATGAHAATGSLATAGVAGKLATTALSAKSLTGVAIVLSAGAGAGLLHDALRHRGAAARAGMQLKARSGGSVGAASAGAGASTAVRHRAAYATATAGAAAQRGSRDARATASPAAGARSGTARHAAARPSRVTPTLRAAASSQAAAHNQAGRRSAGQQGVGAWSSWSGGSGSGQTRSHRPIAATRRTSTTGARGTRSSASHPAAGRGRSSGTRPAARAAATTVTVSTDAMSPIGRLAGKPTS